MAENSTIHSFSKMVKISGNAVSQLSVPSSEYTPQISKIPSTAILPDLPVAQEQVFRDDGVYVDVGLFTEVQKQEVLHEVHTREVKEALRDKLKPFQKKQKLLTNLDTPFHLRELHQCLVKNEKVPLKCHQMTKNFVDYVKDVTHSHK